MARSKSTTWFTELRGNAVWSSFDNHVTLTMSWAAESPDSNYYVTQFECAVGGLVDGEN